VPIIQPDLSNISSASEPGTYQGSINQIDDGRSKDKGIPQITCHCTYVAGGKTKRNRVWVQIAGDGAWKFDKLLRAAGFAEEADHIRADKTATFNTDKLIGVPINFTVENELYNGELQDKITGFLKV
jgi:hypothetical protein